MLRIFLLVTLIVTCTSIYLPRDVRNVVSKKWWETTLVYQIYPRSFQDSDGDGTGDLKGITSRLDSLVELGVGTLWISPIYKSPMADFGYDISDYKDIDPIFGTMEDFDELANKTEKLGIKLVMDFVPNHSSNEHEWFIKSEMKDGNYTDYYVWKNGSDKNPDDSSCTKYPNGTVCADMNKCNYGRPNNWLSVFRFSAWTWSEKREQYYYHAFLPEQPDLNYRNDAIHEEMEDIITFWINKGIDGFRMDAVPFMYEDERFENEPPCNRTADVGDCSQNPDDYDYLNHLYTWNLPEHYTTLKDFHNIIGKLEGDQLMMVEALSADFTTADMMHYYTVSDFAFNFNLIVHLPSPLTGTNIMKQVRDWLNNLPEGRVANWVLGNHDISRVGTRFGEGNIDGMNMVSLLLPGVAVTYQGEEIGMTDTHVAWNDTVDPAGINCGEENYTNPGCTRDPERTPMQWDTTKFAGFSTGDKTWLPVNENYNDGVNVDDQNKTSESHLKVYQKITKLRGSDVIKNGKIKIRDSQDMFAFSRYTNDHAYIVVMIVTGKNTTTNINLNGIIGDTISNPKAVIELRSAGSNNPFTKEGAAVDLANIKLNGFEAVVIEVSSSSSMVLMSPILVFCTFMMKWI